MKLDRNSQQAAARVIERLLPEGRSRIEILRFLGSSIERANALEPAAWGVTLTDQMLRLNVGRIETLTVTQDSVHLVLTRGSLPRGLESMADVVLHPDTGSLHPSVPGSIACDIPASQFPAARAQVAESHRVLLEHAARTASRTSWAASHSPGVLRYLAGVLGIALPVPAYGRPEDVKISPVLFRRAFNRFQAIHTQKCGSPLESFADPFAFVTRGEGYKTEVAARARAILELQRWTKGMIGSGQILRHVIQAIEIPGNNLLQWEGRNGPTSRVHLRLIEAQENRVGLRELESLFHGLYRQGLANEETFEGLVERCGQRYELLAYLFFIADPNRFLPLRTRSFDKAMAELGLELRTEGKCGWENYQAFLAAMREVQRCLGAEGLSDARLLDAHSFCWILSQVDAGRTDSGSHRPIPIVPFEGSFQLVDEPAPFSPKDDAQIRDMQAEAEKRRASGMIGEEVALEAEKARLVAAGKPDLAARVQSCGDRPGLGYDIHSFEEDGSDRFIEVKNVTRGRRFFLTEGEWLNSRTRANYWFYLVDTELEVVRQVPAEHLQQEHLRPVQYLVSLSEEPRRSPSRPRRNPPNR
jgi:hypothetical protein